MDKIQEFKERIDKQDQKIDALTKGLNAVFKAVNLHDESIKTIGDFQIKINNALLVCGNELKGIQRR